MEIKDYTEEFISRVKSHEKMKALEFIPAYSSLNGNNAIRKTVVVAMLNDTQIKNELVGNVISRDSVGTFFKTDLSFRIYIPYVKSGQLLTKHINNLCTAVLDSDTEKTITNLSYSEIVYDAQLQAIYRELIVTIEYLIYGGDENVC